MTVGAAAFGADAGAAVLAALGAVEAVGAGDIGGFAVFAGIGADGELLRAETQRGGLAALRRDLESRGLTARGQAATVAALISSGPDRPEPLDQFLPGSGAGLVTGHRLPNTPGGDGVPLNAAVLRRLEAGVTPSDAVTALLAGNPETDAGLIAVVAGRVACADSRRVGRRNDRGDACLEIRGGAAGVAILHNSIRPHEGLAALAAGAARLVLEAALPPLASFRVPAGITLALGDADGVWLDRDGAVDRIATGNPGLARYTGWTSSAVYLGTPVVQGGRAVGVTVAEARCRLDRGRILEVDPARPTVAWRPAG